jgi:hypothetical protein
VVRVAAAQSCASQEETIKEGFLTKQGMLSKPALFSLRRSFLRSSCFLQAAS